ncbi:MAG: SDR family oxidoreductase [Ilumatobacter sp.]|nr:SDR family oxidoreductase [Ilumatobacter sp.]
MSDRIAFVAGASGSLGPTLCRSLAAEGFSVVAHAHSNGGAVDGIVDSLDGDHLAVVGELASDDGPSEPVSRAIERFGRVDVLVNAAHPPWRSAAQVADLSLGDLSDQLTGVVTHAAVCRDVLPSMRSSGGGRIVFVAGALMRRPAAGFSAYGAAKAAAATLTRYIALEEGRYGITANIVAPGRIVDPNEPEDIPPDKQQLAEELRRRLALGAFPSPDDVANTIVSLVRHEGRALTGQTVWVTGGEPIE